MKKLLWIFAVILVILLIGVLIARFAVSQMWKKHAENTKALKGTLISGINDLEYQYGQDLHTEVAEYLQSVDGDTCTEYMFYYPADLSEETYPVVVWGNGTGNTYVNYEPGLKSLASYGFIVIGCNDSNMGSGKTLYDMTLSAQKANTDPDHPLYGKFDLTRIGIGGHSQGACGAVNAATRYGKSAELYTSLFTTSMPKLEMCVDRTFMKFAYWKYDVSGIRIPYFATSGTGSFDSRQVAPLQSMKDNLANLPEDTTAIIARQIGANHNIVNEYHGCGCFNAWFCWTLKGDETAGSIFQEDGELKKNTDRWTDVQIH